MQIVLHIGAHKTASTHLQLALARARPALAARGVVLFGPDELRRKGLRLPEYLSLSPDDPGLEAHGAQIRAAFAQPAGRLLISDENVLGNAHNVELVRTARFYDRAAGRLARLMALLPAGTATGVTLALAIRDPAGFVVSAYAQRLMSGRLEGFAQYCGALDPASLRWSELLTRLQRVAPQVRWLLWRFEDYPGNADAVLDALLGEAAGVVRPGAGVAHPGLSQAAHGALMAEAAQLSGLGDEVIRKRVAAARAAWPKGPEHPGYQPFDTATLDRSAAAYAQDQAVLAALPGVRALWP